jgi:hypothetical protein
MLGMRNAKKDFTVGSVAAILSILVCEYGILEILK